MSFFTNLRADRLVAEIRSGTGPSDPAVQKAAAKLKSLGPGAIDAVLAALPEADKNVTVVLVDVLSGLISAKTFPRFLRGLVAGAYQQEPNEKAALFRIIGEIADANSVPELLGRLHGKDAIARVHIINILSRFNLPEVQTAVLAQLKDPHKLIRGASLDALRKMDKIVDVQRLCALLRDPEIDVQNKAVDVVIKANHPDTVRYLIDVLKDENEYARRSAVEVLNEVGNAGSVKYLLQALTKDNDWWVRSRAADALGKIGGPRVIDAVLQLVQDKDEDIRRAAIEILNQTKDERAVDHLIQATHDNDWWVSERAIDALAEIGSKRALPRLLEMLKTGNAKALPVVVRALGKRGEPQHIDAILPMLARPEREIRIEAIQALAKLADDRQAEQVRAGLQTQINSEDQTVARLATAALAEMDVRTGNSAVTAPGTLTSVAAQVARASASAPPRPPAASGTTVMPEAALAQARKQAETRLDITTLKTGDIIEGRYKYIDRIGRGAFGTVLLMEDTVVDERLILKFLNPNVAEDEEVMKRFVHELRYSRKITHKNVIRIYDFLYLQGLYAISMEYFPSPTLSGEIVNEKPMDLKRALQFGIDIATGMAVAHQVGIVHRDLKPANVLINQDGLLKIVDFGVAAAHRNPQSSAGHPG